MAFRVLDEHHLEDGVVRLLHSDGLYSYGQCSDALNSHGPRRLAYVVMAYVVMAYRVLDESLVEDVLVRLL